MVLGEVEGLLVREDEDLASIRSFHPVQYALGTESASSDVVRVSVAETSAWPSSSDLIQSSLHVSWSSGALGVDINVGGDLLLDGFVHIGDGLPWPGGIISGPMLLLDLPCVPYSINVDAHGLGNGSPGLRSLNPQMIISLILFQPIFLGHI